MLDEATSALDIHTERRSRTRSIASRANRTTLVIAHRLSTVIHADEIMVLDEGVIVERGTHDAPVGGRRPLCQHVEPPARGGRGTRDAARVAGEDDAAPNRTPPHGSDDQAAEATTRRCMSARVSTPAELSHVDRRLGPLPARPDPPRRLSLHRGVRDRKPVPDVAVVAARLARCRRHAVVRLFLP